VTGRLAVVGLGPGGGPWLTGVAAERLRAATDVVGYAPYVAQVPPAPSQARHPSDNREELARAAFALDLAAAGRDVALVSSGDPGVFAMASAVFEVVESAPPERWRGVAITVVPGVTAALAGAAIAGAPLGHDWCAISLSDNLKPWAVVERRLRAAASADFALALYNPVSRARPWQLGRALDVLREHRAPDTPVVLATDVGRPPESVRVEALGGLPLDAVGSRTVLLVGSSTTRRVRLPDGAEAVYTPRRWP